MAHGVEPDDPCKSPLATADGFNHSFPKRGFTRRRFLELLVAASVVGPVGQLGLPASSEAAIAPPGEPALLTILGILQPVGIQTIHKFIEVALAELGGVTSEAYLAAMLDRSLRENRIMAVGSAPYPLYSLTAAGNASLPRSAQIFRDRARVFLMRGRARANFKGSRGSGVAGGVPPPEWIRARIEDFVERPRPFGSWAFLADRKSGKRPFPRDTSLPLISFGSLAQVNAALGNLDAGVPLTMDGLALCLGLSPGLLAWFASKSEVSYRRFSIPKRRGGVRQIDSPRIYLKVTQRLLLEFFLSGLKVHDAVYSFRKGRSSAANAIRHERQEFVGGLDIQDYFGSVTLPMVVQCLVDNGFDAGFARRFAQLVTLHNVLPQGAPTSPVLSNALLFQFDEQMTVACTAAGLNYSRYADDIVVSGPSRAGIERMFDLAERELQSRYGLRLNDDKKRITPRSSRQTVTGAVVNVSAAPGRSLRRRVRAMFHQADKNPAQYRDRARKLRGYIGYFNNFPALSRSAELARYREILKRVMRS
jgi:hypothetical protein